MRLWIPLLIAGLAGCGKRAAPTLDDAAAPVAAATKPAAAVEPGEPLAAFTGVVSTDGSARSLEDLRGQPTVVWFFPFAGTPG